MNFSTVALVDMIKILVLSYSRTGFTQAIAEEIARACGTDLELIEDVNQRGRASGFVRCAVEAVLHLQTAVCAARYMPDDYDIVVIGTPVWFWNVASPVRSYIKLHRSQFRRVAFFCSYGSSGHAKVLRDLESLCGRPSVATLAVADADVSGGFYRDRLSQFTAVLRGADRSRGWVSRIEETFEESTIGS